MKPAAVLFLLAFFVPAHAGEGSGGVLAAVRPEACLALPVHALTVTLPPDLPAAETFTLDLPIVPNAPQTPTPILPEVSVPAPVTAHIERDSTALLALLREAEITAVPNPPKRYSPLWFMRGRVRTHADLVRYYQFLSAADENRRLSR